MKKKKFFLSYYKKCMKDGTVQRMPHNYAFNGMCYFLDPAYRGGGNKVWKLVNPTDYNFNELLKQDLSTAFWGSGLKEEHIGCRKEFTELRQTLVLLCAAINNEL